MKVISDKLWQDQVSILKQSLDEETWAVYLEIVEQVTDHAVKTERMSTSGVSPRTVTESVREGFGEVFREKGYLIPEVLSSILVVLILHWEYGEQLREGLSPIEASLVAEAMATHLSMKAEAAASGQ